MSPHASRLLPALFCAVVVLAGCAGETDPPATDSDAAPAGGNSADAAPAGPSGTEHTETGSGSGGVVTADHSTSETGSGIEPTGLSVPAQTPRGDLLLAALEDHNGDLKAALAQICVQIRENPNSGDLIVLHVDGPGITDPALEKIGTLNTLRVLDISNSSITDDGLDHLKGLTQLIALGLRGSSITNGGLSRLTPMTDLQELNLTGTGVTDSGMESLVSLRSLRRVCFDDTGVSGTGVNQLQVALPLCTIGW